MSSHGGTSVTFHSVSARAVYDHQPDDPVRQNESPISSMSSMSLEKDDTEETGGPSSRRITSLDEPRRSASSVPPAVEKIVQVSDVLEPERVSIAVTEAPPPPAGHAPPSSEKIKSDPVILWARNLSYSIYEKVILKNVNITCRSGDLTVILGPSGSGKTTLLNCLAGRITKFCQGNVGLNNSNITKDISCYLINYVMAHDRLHEYLTVQETLINTAVLKMPHKSWTFCRDTAIGLMKDLQLYDCRDTLIGGTWRKGISKGQMKRVCIAQELIGDPAVLILDEPTTGLDSSLSLELVNILKEVARARNIVVVCTLHQPNQRIFNRLDSLVLMAEGEVLYEGPPTEAILYFWSIGQLPMHLHLPPPLIEALADLGVTITDTAGEGGQGEEDEGEGVDDIPGKRNQQADTTNDSVPDILLEIATLRKHDLLGLRTHKLEGDKRFMVSRRNLLLRLKDGMSLVAPDTPPCPPDDGVTPTSAESEALVVSPSRRVSSPGNSASQEDPASFAPLARLSQIKIITDAQSWPKQFSVEFMTFITINRRNPLTILIVMLTNIIQAFVLGAVFFQVNSDLKNVHSGNFQDWAVFNLPIFRYLSDGLAPANVTNPAPTFQHQGDVFNPFTGDADFRSPARSLLQVDGSQLGRTGGGANGSLSPFATESPVSATDFQNHSGLTSDPHHRIDPLRDMLVDGIDGSSQSLIFDLVANPDMLDWLYDFAKCARTNIISPLKNGYPRWDWVSSDEEWESEMEKTLCAPQDQTEPAPGSERNVWWNVVREGAKMVSSSVTGWVCDKTYMRGSKTKEKTSPRFTKWFTSSKTSTPSPEDIVATMGPPALLQQNLAEFLDDTKCWNWEHEYEDTTFTNFHVIKTTSAFTGLMQVVDMVMKDTQPWPAIYDRGDVLAWATFQTRIAPYANLVLCCGGNEIGFGGLLSTKCSKAIPNYDLPVFPGRIYWPAFHREIVKLGTQPTMLSAALRSLEELFALPQPQGNHVNAHEHEPEPPLASTPPRNGRSAAKRRLGSGISGLVTDLLALIVENPDSPVYIFMVVIRGIWTRVEACNTNYCGWLRGAVADAGSAAGDVFTSALTVLNFCGVIFFLVANLGFSSYDVLLQFPKDRAISNRERANGMYRTSAFLLGKMLADLPYNLIPGIVWAIIYYLMVGMSGSTASVFAYIGIAALIVFSAYSLGYLVSALVPNLETTIVLSPCIMVAMLVLAGFFLRDSEMPDWIGWAKYFSIYRWAYFAVILIQFPPGGAMGAIPNALALTLAGVTETSIYKPCCYLLAQCFGCRLLTYFALKHLHTKQGIEA